MRVCTVCTHPARDEINRELINQASYRSVAKRFAVSEPATFRHRQNMPAILVKAHEAKEIAQADSLLGEIRELVEKARALAAKAEEEGDVRTALVGLREVARVLEFRARIGGEMGGAPIDITAIDRLTDDQADELYEKLAKRRLVRLIPPEERAGIAARIEEAIIGGILFDPAKRERLRARLAAMEAAEE